MKCKNIKIDNFRNIRSEYVEFSDGTNLLWGDNAQGKTNMLEALCFFSLGKSFRGAKDSEYIAFDSKDASLTLEFEDSVREHKMRFAFSRDKTRSAEQNGFKVNRISEIIGQFRAVLFCPEHLNIVKEGPAMRRNYLDVAISQLRPMYLRSLQRYNHILVQRNKLIKNAEYDRRSFDSTIEFWSYQLAHEAAYVISSRLKYVSLAEKELESCFYDMTERREVPSLEYENSFKISYDDAIDTEKSEKLYLSKLMSSHEREINAGATLFGPHKDDLSIEINDKNARTFASQGQQRSLALGLKLAESAVSRSDTGETPVLLLDDVFSELDSSRRDYLTKKIGHGQVIMTSCGDIAAADLANVNVINVKNGIFG